MRRHRALLEITPVAYAGADLDLDAEGNVAITEVYIVDPDDEDEVVTARFATSTVAGEDDADDVITHYRITNSQRSGYGSAGSDATDAIAGGAGTAATAATDADGGPGGRLSFVSLSGGFGTITLGQIWSASANHYGFAVDPSHVNGSFGGTTFRNANSISYSSSAGDVSFQVDKVTGDAEKTEFGATANLGPIGVGVGYWSSGIDDSGFTGFALSTGAAGVDLTVGLGSVDTADGTDVDISILKIAGSLGDSGVSYGVQVTNSDVDADDQNLVALTNSLGSGASLVFEHLDPGGDADSSSLIGLRVDF